MCLLSLMPLPPVSAQPAAPPAFETVDALRAHLQARVDAPRFAAAQWGIKIVSLETGKTLFEYQAEKLLSPASNAKLYTTAVALDRLGPDYRIRTSLYARRGPDRHGTLPGDLIVFGRGDPAFNTRLHDGDIFRALHSLVAALTNAGVHRIHGDLVGDESFFRGAPYGSGWVWDDFQYYYGAPLSALTINDNTLKLVVQPGGRVAEPCRVQLVPPTDWVRLINRTRTVAREEPRRLTRFHPVARNEIFVMGQMPLGDERYTTDITVNDPAGLFVTWFKAALARQGVKLTGRVRTVNWLDRQITPLAPASLIELGVVESPPLRVLLREIQKPSQNLYTDLLLAHLAEVVRATNAALAELDSEAIGIRELQRFLAEIGVPRNQVFYEEGSGLSRNNLNTAAATVRLLAHMHRHRWADTYRDALPVAGVDGTLRNRMKDTAAAGNMRAKTGTLRWANSLSGYVTSAAGEPLAFALMLNRYHNPNPDQSPRAELDAIAVMLANLRAHSRDWTDVSTGPP